MAVAVKAEAKVAEARAVEKAAVTAVEVMVEAMAEELMEEEVMVEVEMVGGHLTIHPQVLIIKSQQVAVLILVVEVEHPQIRQH